MSRNFYISCIGGWVGLTMLSRLLSGDEGGYFLRVNRTALVFCISIGFLPLVFIIKIHN